MDINKELEEVKNKLKAIEEHISKSKAKPKRWRAKEEMYWLIDDNGELCKDMELFDFGDNFRYKTGNYYQTRELAQKALDKIEALATECKDLDDHGIKYTIETVIIKE